jgi:general secretion pathway protein D
VGTRTASTLLRLHDGETQVLAGLIDEQDRNNVDKIPGFGDVPLLGRLFSKHKDNKSKTEIVLSITPRIIREKVVGSAHQNEYWIGSEGRVGKRSASPIFKAGDTPPFMVPKPAAAKPALKENKPESLNIPLPSGFNIDN